MVVADDGFFFQAEDGIRDLTVTGVQTCALPISLAQAAADVVVRRPGTSVCTQRELVERLGRHDGTSEHSQLARIVRSEERRVGKECRSRWRPQHEKKKRSFAGEVMDAQPRLVAQ